LLAVNQGTLYPVLLKLEQEGAIASEWRASQNNRRAEDGEGTIREDEKTSTNMSAKSYARTAGIEKRPAN